MKKRQVKFEKYIDPLNSNLEEVELSEAAIYYLTNGQSIINHYGLKSNGKIKLVSKHGRFLGIREITESDKIKPIKLVSEI